MRYPNRAIWPLMVAGILLAWGSVPAAKAQEPPRQTIVKPIAAPTSGQPTPGGQQAGQQAARKRTMDPNRFSGSYGYPGTGVDPLPLPGPRPYWGQAIGATYYNWGFFGARRRAQYFDHTGYYGEYTEFGYSKGY